MYAPLVSQTYFINGQLGRNVLVLDSCISFKIKTNNVSFQIIWHVYPSVPMLCTLHDSWTMSLKIQIHVL